VTTSVSSRAQCAARSQRATRHLRAARRACCAALCLVAAGPARLSAQEQLIQQLADAMRGMTTSAPAESGRAPVAIGETGLLNVNVRDTEIAVVLEMLSYQSRSNIVASTSVKGRISANLYDVTLPQALEAILLPNHYAYRRVGHTIFVGTPQEIAAHNPPPQTRIFRLRYISTGEALNAVGALLGEHGKALAGGASQTESRTEGGRAPGEASGDYLIVTASPERLEAVARLLAEVDVRPRQVLIEATILRATLTEKNELGIDFTLLGGVDFQNVLSVSDAATNVRTGPLLPDEFQDTNFNVNTGFTANVTPGGLTFGIIKNNIGVFLRALEGVTDVVVVANPKVIALNKQEAEVIVGRRDGYLTTTVTQTAAIQTVEFLETGTQVKIRPIINDDGTVRLYVYPKDSNGGLTAANLPFEETTEAKAEILVNDGHTVLIGGLFRERTVGSRSQIPVLGNIPLAGVLFQSRMDQTVREEVIVLLTVHVLKETPEEAGMFAELLDDVERVRVGSRRGLSGLGRERLAQAFYQEALRQAEQGNDELALLNARMTLHNHPKHVAAFKLKERIQGRRMWDGEGSRVRTFVLELIDEAESQRTGSEPVPFFGRPLLDRNVAPQTPAQAGEDGAPGREDQP
jgi:type IV pilus assembly protein PilQ